MQFPEGNLTDAEIQAFVRQVRSVYESHTEVVARSKEFQEQCGGLQPTAAARPESFQFVSTAMNALLKPARASARMLLSLI
jgi:hypothetical protein